MQFQHLVLFVSEYKTKLDGFSEGNPKLDGFSEPIPKLDGFSKPMPKLDGFSEGNPKLDGFSEPIPKLDGFSKPIPKLDGFSKPIPKLDGFSKSIPKLDGFSEPIPKLDGFSKPIPKLDGFSKPIPKLDGFSKPNSKLDGSDLRMVQFGVGFRKSNLGMGFENPSQIYKSDVSVYRPKCDHSEVRLSTFWQRIQKLVTIHLVFPGADFVTKVRSQWSHFNGFSVFWKIQSGKIYQNLKKNNGFGTIVTSLWSQNQPLGKQGEM